LTNPQEDTVNEKQQPQDHLPDEAKTHTFLVYDEKTGDLVHGHKAVILPYGEAPDEKQLMEQALEMAAEATGRKDGLRVLAVLEDELEPGTVYRVDPESERLEKAEVEGAA
jgi:hypothetical protein